MFEEAKQILRYNNKEILFYSNSITCALQGRMDNRPPFLVLTKYYFMRRNRSHLTTTPRYRSTPREKETGLCYY